MGFRYEPEDPRSIYPPIYPPKQTVGEDIDRWTFDIGPDSITGHTRPKSLIWPWIPSRRVYRHKPPLLERLRHLVFH